VFGVEKAALGKAAFYFRGYSRPMALDLFFDGESIKTELCPLRIFSRLPFNFYAKQFSILPILAPYQLRK
jgi:hypothetical protein